MNKKFVFIILFTIYTVSCSEVVKHPQERAVIGNDDRQLYTNKYDFPFTVIGTITGGPTTCTAYLIGSNHVLSSCHCVYPDTDSNYYFAPSYNNAIGTRLYQSFSVTNVLRGVQGNITKDSNGNLKFPSGYSLADDWVILILNEPIGKSFGYLKFTDFSINWLNKPLFSMVSYQNKYAYNDNLHDSNGFYPLYQPICQMKQIENEVLYHDCDVLTKEYDYSSGGPILINLTKKGYFVVATQTSTIGLNCTKYSSGKCANIAIKPSQSFLNTLKYAVTYFNL